MIHEKKLTPKSHCSGNNTMCRAVESLAVVQWIVVQKTPSEYFSSALRKECERTVNGIRFGSELIQ